jgi:two-component system, chemotaxis family, protein-glutamate methylesterase/glutaminase
MIRVLLVDDSEVSLMMLHKILENEPGIEIIGHAHFGEEAISMVSDLKPDIISMDINMPGYDGFVTTRKIMESTPVPIILVSGIDNLEEIKASFKAIEAGALAVFRKPPSLKDPGYRASALEFVSAIRTYSEVKVIQRRNCKPEKKAISNKDTVNNFNKIITDDIIYACRKVSLVVIGASTGGPQVIQQILSGLSDTFSIPVIVVQHMSPGFIEGFSNWLMDTTGVKTQIPMDKDFIRPGVICIAPDRKHIGIRNDFKIELSDDPPEYNLKPSVSYLFRSASKNYGKNTLGILLTGMGSDGARELLLIKEKGGCTIIQNRESSFVYGMPGTAEKLNAGMFSLSPEEITRVLNGLSDYRIQIKHN